jgi:membrane-associated protease RseP (regulator of RpoE activity)
MSWLVLFFVAHELGHVLAAQVCGNPCRQLRLGCGPVLARRSWHGFRLVLALLPVGLAVGIESRRPGHNRLVAAGGLGAGLAVALLALAWGVLANDAALAAVGLVCVLTTAINALPLPGLDGYFLAHPERT